MLMPKDRGSSGRRGFFREALGRAISPLADLVEGRIPGEPAPTSRAAGQRKPRPPSAPTTANLLRPPGALPEEAFLDTCSRCYKCVEVCPVQAIKPRPGPAPDEEMPVIEPDLAACVLCAGVLCTHACPTGALQPLESVYDVAMGVAEVYDGVCVRSDGQDCTICVDKCPIAEIAIRINDEGPPEVLAGCTGCGVCQLYCPTEPKAIVVKQVEA